MQRRCNAKPCGSGWGARREAGPPPDEARPPDGPGAGGASGRKCRRGRRRDLVASWATARRERPKGRLVTVAAAGWRARESGPEPSPCAAGLSSASSPPAPPCAQSLRCGRRSLPRTRLARPAAMAGAGSLIALPLGLMFFFSGFLINALQVRAPVFVPLPFLVLGHCSSFPPSSPAFQFLILVLPSRAPARSPRAGAVDVVRAALLPARLQGRQYDNDGGVVVGAHLASGLVGRREGACFGCPRLLHVLPLLACGCRHWCPCEIGIIGPADWFFVPLCFLFCRCGSTRTPSHGSTWVRC